MPRWAVPPSGTGSSGPTMGNSSSARGSEPRQRPRASPGPALTALNVSLRAAGRALAIGEDGRPITLVLAEDGTIVDDEDYFLCLPSNTKFVALAKGERWSGRSAGSGEPADEVDSGAERWRQLARQLKGDLANIILMSEEDLQVLVDVPCSDLAEELAQSQAKTQVLQDTLQQVLDRREEERQSKQLLELYLEALKNEDNILSKVAESESAPGKEMDVVDTGTSSAGTSARTALSNQIFAVLKEKPAPELCLDSQTLELVVKEDTQALAAALGWDKQKAEAVQQACDQELSKRLQQVQTLHSLRSTSRGKKALPYYTSASSVREMQVVVGCFFFFFNN
uniref:CIDE-N domain-containing protein n=1 Tax=Meleagris gallopavo TaxID=9103 RepID=A0A803Y557_MELGA